MNVLSAGLDLFRRASERLDAAADGVAHDPTDAAKLVDAKLATVEGAVAAKLVKAGEDMAGHLLDLFA